MEKIILDNLPAIMTALVSVIGALSALIVSICVYRKKLIDLKVQNLVLEKEKVCMEKSIYDGSYYICPKCGFKVKLSDMHFETEKEVSK